MRTTLSLDDDVAALLARVQANRSASLKAIVNEALRHGLTQMATPETNREIYATKEVSLGRCTVPLDDISEALAIVEGEAFG